MYIPRKDTSKTFDFLILTFIVTITKRRRSLLLLCCNVFVYKTIEFLEKVDQESGKRGTKNAERPLEKICRVLRIEYYIPYRGARNTGDESLFSPLQQGTIFQNEIAKKLAEIFPIVFQILVEGSFLD